ncbi:hypothetical protein P4O66_021064 [Electrophorus voltai]|uniref:Ig-like domain-containing protein n=1 Tax=Electrophorus voltai TaxID=2609070 RepID=A0AAD9E688_9TELE|nr:hypothetical protein P4O66_021064 [Electrophorus voltai]
MAMSRRLQTLCLCVAAIVCLCFRLYVYRRNVIESIPDYPKRGREAAFLPLVVRSRLLAAPARLVLVGRQARPCCVRVYVYMAPGGESPPASLIISPSRTQHFSGDSLSLSCEGQSDSAGWRLRRYTHSWGVSGCSDWGSVTGSTCTIRYLYTSHTGVYWCQSESGRNSNPVNITVHNGGVILESPVHPVTEGDPLILRCLLHLTIASDFRADFYKDGILIQNQTRGEMTIHSVSKSDEGLYQCKNSERRESPYSWVSVRGKKAMIKPI